MKINWRTKLKTILFWFVLLLGINSSFAGNDKIKIHYAVDLTKIETDSFFVTLDVEGIKTDSIVFQFASTAPGIYQRLDVGRFVGNFEAFDISGNRLKIFHGSVNQYVIYHAELLSKIKYQVEDSYDTNIKEFPVFLAAGSNLEDDNAVINGQMVFGYFQGFQQNPISIKFNYPADWLVGTALPVKNENFYAEDYDHLVDSPIMFGDLTKSILEISDTKVEVYCYSQNKVITASILADTLEHIVNAVEKLLGTLPVKHYAFLFHFRKDGQGEALEHNYSSYYTLPVDEVSSLLKDMAPTAAHEFCHIVTPLHIHSDIIEHFNFEKPIASRNLWFYEGITSWMSNMACLRGGLISEKDYFNNIVSHDLNTSIRRYDSTVSLTESSLGCYDQYEFEWRNAYFRAQVLGVLIDLKIYEMSGFKFGFRDVINKMLSEYTAKSFPDDKLFDIIEEFSYPEIGDMLERYVSGIELLPIKEFLNKIGYNLIPEVKTGKYEGYISKWSYGMKDNIFFVKNPDVSDSVIVQLGIKDGDILKKLVYNGDEISFNDARIDSVWDAIEPGKTFSWMVDRDGEEMKLTSVVGKREIIERNKIIPITNPTTEQLEFRKLWMTNNESHN